MFIMIVEKIDILQKKDLKILVEDYLEKNITQLLKQYNEDINKSVYIFSNIFRILSRNTILPNNITVDDLTADELKDTIIEWHQLLKPMWNKFKLYLNDYRRNILPEKKKYNDMVSAAGDPSSGFSEYKELIDYSTIKNDKTYSLKIRSAPLTIDLSFDSEKVSIVRGDINVFHSFLDIIKDIPIDFFAQCEHCNKYIVITREGKRYCSGCAAKAKQQQIWKQDRDACRKKEKLFLYPVSCLFPRVHPSKDISYHRVLVDRKDACCKASFKS